MHGIKGDSFFKQSHLEAYQPLKQTGHLLLLSRINCKNSALLYVFSFMHRSKETLTDVLLCVLTLCTPNTRVLLPCREVQACSCRKPPSWPLLPLICIRGGGNNSLSHQFHRTTALVVVHYFMNDPWFIIGRHLLFERFFCL